MKKMILICAALASLLSACNTVQGAGQDIRNAGQGISNSAEKVKEKL